MDILSRISHRDFDVRKSGDARFMDQKVTLDVLCIISECILEFVKKESVEFSVRDIWESDYAQQVVAEYFGKPPVVNDSAEHEYDKFFSQPIKTLSYSGILSSRKDGNRFVYTVSDFGLLAFIAAKERNAYAFLIIYLEKVLQDSGVLEVFIDFFKKQDKTSFQGMKGYYESFIIGNTKINHKLEVRRIFTKVLNPLAYKNKSKGTERGYLSKDVINYSDLFYNRLNFRDGGKMKKETRQEYDNRMAGLREQGINVERVRMFNVSRAKKKIREYHNKVSEISDEHANAEATHVHHIFPQNEFPDLDSILENLILLTPTQHYNKAHPSGNTQQVDKDYQLMCLCAKSYSVENSLKKDDGFYSKEDYVFVLNTGLSPEDEFDNSSSFKKIRERLGGTT